jgi:hypothetical protein
LGEEISHFRMHGIAVLGLATLTVVCRRLSFQYSLRRLKMATHAMS